MAGDGNEVYDTTNDGLYLLTMWYVALMLSIIIYVVCADV
jgi:hypothetical protein